ncbi:MAG: oligosaccharide flippase family protein [Candidatus Sabulitectum sp.]|nr:oligosaccharide flippase family protein [Candidatus Sabulitectum sp.]
MAGRRANSAYMLLGQIFGKAGLFVSLMIYSRLLSDGAFGELLFAVSMGLIVIFLSDMGATMLITRRIAAGSPVDRTLSSAIFLRTGLSVIAVSTVMLAGWAGGYSNSQLILMLMVSTGFILDGFCETSFAVFRARELMINEGTARALHGVLGILLAVFAWYTGKGVLFAGSTYLIRQLPALIFVYYVLRKLGFRIDVSKSVLRSSIPLFKAAVPLGIVGILMAAGLRIDSIFIKANLGNAAVASYQQSIKIFETLVLIVTPTLLPGALFAALCEAARKGWGNVREKIVWMTELFAVIAAAVVLPLWASELTLLRLIWGNEFLRGVSQGTALLVFRIIIITLPAAYFFHLYMSVIIAEERQKSALPLVALSLLIQIGLLFFLVPLAGTLGAAIAYLSLFSMVALLFAWKLNRIHGPTGFARGIKRPLTAFLPAFSIVVMHPFIPVINAVLSLAVFFTTWFIIGGREIIPGLNGSGKIQ